jgi:UDP-N-acetylmuramate: L-alanyl-gamma-D-glutamyl-meso-diaminopimelate ligase
MGSKALVAANIDELVNQVMSHAKAGDHLLCMSNGGFGGIHDQLLNALKQR